MATARTSDLPLLNVSGADSPRSRLGRGLESIGGMTAETLQRISTTVGGVVKLPVVSMAKVGGLPLPQETTLTAPLENSLEERVFHLEIQMKSFEENFGSRTIVTELDLSPCSHKEKPQIAKALLQDMETEGMLVKRVQMLEDCVNERIERIEKALSSIQSQLDLVKFSRRESVDGYERPESLSSELQYYDADQHSDHFEAPEVGEQSFFGAHGVPDEAIGGGPTLEKSHVKETLSATPTTIEHIEPVQEINNGKNDDFLDPQVVSTPEYSKEVFLMQPMKSVAPSSEPTKSAHKNDASNLPASLDRQLASTLEELHGSFVSESSATTASAKFLEIARAVTTEKSTLAHASLEPQPASIFKEPQEAFSKKPWVAIPVAKSEEHVQEDVVDKSGTTIVVVKTPSPPTFEAIQKDFTKEPLEAALNTNPAQELATQGPVSITLASSERPVTSKLVEEPSVVVPSANFKESSHEDMGDKNVTMTAVGESPKAFAFQDPQEDFMESLASALGVGPTHEPSLQEDLCATSDMTLASSESPLASKCVEEPSTTTLGTNFEEPTQEDADVKKGSTIAFAELPLASSLEEPQEESIKEFMATATNVDSKEPAQKDVVEKIGTTMASRELSLASSLEEPKEGFEKESMTSAPSGELVQEHGDMVVESFETKGASKFVEEALVASPSAIFRELAYKADAHESGTITIGAESPLAFSFDDLQEDFEKEPLVVAPTAKPTQQLAIQEDTSMTFAAPKTTVKSKFAEGPSTFVASVGFEEPAHEDADKGVTMTAAGESPLPTSHQGPHEDFEKKFLTTTPSDGPIHEHSLQENLGATSDKALASSEPQVASKFVEEPLSTVPSVNFEESTPDEDAFKSDTISAGANSPLASSSGESQENFEKESLATSLSHKFVQGLATKEDSCMAPTSSESQEASKSMEKPSATVPCANFEELVHTIDKNVSMTAAGVSPFASSYDGPHEDFEKESIATTPSTKHTQDLATQDDSDMAPLEPIVASKFVEDPLPIDVPSVEFEELAHEDYVDKSGIVIVAVESPLVSSLEEPHEDYMKESLAPRASAKVLEPTKEDEFGKSPIAFAPLEAPSTSFSEIPQEAFSKESLGTSVQPKEHAQEKNGIVLLGAESTLTSIVEVGNHEVKEVEYKLAEDFKVHDEHIKSIEKEFPRGQSNLAHVSSNKLKPKSLAAEDSDSRLESDESGEEFFDAEHGSGDSELWESDDPKSFEEFGVGPDEPGEATGISDVVQKETLVPTLSMEFAQDPMQEPEQEPIRELAQELGEDHENGEQAPRQEHKQHFGEELEHQSIQEHGQQHTQEHGQERGKQPAQQSIQELGHKPEQQSEQLAQKPEQEDLTRNNAIVLLLGESQVTSKFGESQELLAEKSEVALPSSNFEEPAQANATDKSGTRDLPLTSTAEEPQIDTIVSPKKSLLSASFHQSGNHELLENLEHKSSDTPGTSSTPQEALEREPLTIAPITEIAERHDVGKSDNVHTLLEPQLEESKAPLANELVKVVPSFKSTESAQEVGDGQSGAILASLEPQLTPTLEKPLESFVKEPLADAELTPKHVDLKELHTDKPSAVTTSAKLAQESVTDKISVGLVEDLPLTSIAKELQNDNVNSLVEGKHVYDEANQKFLEDVKIIAKPIEEAIPRTQSDLTHVKLNPKATEDTTKLQSQGSFLALGATSMDSKEALVKESLPSTKLLELFEEENNLGKKVPVLANTPMTSTMEEPRKPLAKELLAGAKSVPKGHAKWRGFARSSSEPQFAYKLEEHQKALVKESSVAAIPSTSKLGEEYAQEDFGDTQCLPFKILGEGKHPQKELDLKLVEDVKSPAMKFETTSSPYILEPKPSKSKEKKKKERKPNATTEEKERKLDATTEEKERRLLLELEKTERKSSLRAQEKDSKYLPQAEEKHKQPFRHLRDRLRHAFSVNKEP